MVTCLLHESITRSNLLKCKYHKTIPIGAACQHAMEHVYTGCSIKYIAAMKHIRHIHDREKSRTNASDMFTRCQMGVTGLQPSNVPIQTYHTAGNCLIAPSASKDMLYALCHSTLQLPQLPSSNPNKSILAYANTLFGRLPCFEWTYKQTHVNRVPVASTTSKAH